MSGGLERLAEIERKRLCELVEDGRLSCNEAVDRAFALGGEFERLDAMHRACEDYSRARQARETAFADAAKRPSTRPPRGVP